jgi:hypothetical protein
MGGGGGRGVADLDDDVDFALPVGLLRAMDANDEARLDNDDCA